MTRPTPRDRQRVTEELRTMLHDPRVRRIDDLRRANVISITMRDWEDSETLYPRVRVASDGTGQGWHRRAAERIAAMIRSWA